MLRVADPAGGDRFLDALTEVAKEDYEAGILSVDRWEEACLCPMVDARRMEVYTRVFDAAGTPLSDVSAEVVTAESFAAWRGDGRPFVISETVRPMCRIAARCDADPGGAFCPRACAAGTGGARCGPHGGYRVLRAFLPEGFRRHPVEKEIILRENIFSGKLISGD